MLTVPWFWNTGSHVAMAPGVHVFVKGMEYAHGGLSLQECLVPEMSVTGTAGAKVYASVDACRWVGMRCRLVVKGEFQGLTVDLRTCAGDASSSVLGESKPVDENGKAALLIENDDLLGTAAVIVLIDKHGELITKHPTTIGGDE
jgi:hypothetical protein